MKGGRKSVPPKGKSHGIAKDPKSGHKYGTGKAGRATPAGYGKTKKKRGNP